MAIRSRASRGSIRSSPDVAIGNAQGCRGVSFMRGFVLFICHGRRCAENAVQSFAEAIAGKGDLLLGDAERVSFVARQRLFVTFQVRSVNLGRDKRKAFLLPL